MRYTHADAHISSRVAIALSSLLCLSLFWCRLAEAGGPVVCFLPALAYCFALAESMKRASREPSSASYKCLLIQAAQLNPTGPARL